MQQTLGETLSRFYGRHRFGIKPGLERIGRLLDLLGHPEARFKCVHVAGTNGKGSVCAMLEAMLRAAGLRTGLYTSPHLVRFNERMRVDGLDIPDGELEPLAVEVEKLAAKVEEELGDQPTFFEVSTALAFAWFARRGAEIVVVETGMGGRLDATNLVKPEACIITSIGLEHTQYLGSTMAEIAREKGGIIKPGIPVVCGRLEDEARVVVGEIARLQHAPLRIAEEAVSAGAIKTDGWRSKVKVDSTARSYGTVTCPLAGPHQVMNMVMALSALECLEERGVVEIDTGTVKRGLAATRWRGRFDVLAEDPVLVLDGAHNPEAAATFVRSLRAIVRKPRVGLVAGMCADKNAVAFASAFRGLAERVWLVPISSERNMEAGILASAFNRLGCPLQQSDLLTALDGAKTWASGEKGGLVIVAGSLFLVGEVLGLWDAGKIAWGGRRETK